MFCNLVDYALYNKIRPIVNVKLCGTILDRCGKRHTRQWKKHGYVIIAHEKSMYRLLMVWRRHHLEALLIYAIGTNTWRMITMNLNGSYSIQFFSNRTHNFNLRKNAIYKKIILWFAKHIIEGVQKLCVAIFNRAEVVFDAVFHRHFSHILMLRVHAPASRQILYIKTQGKLHLVRLDSC